MFSRLFNHVSAEVDCPLLFILLAFEATEVTEGTVSHHKRPYAPWDRYENPVKADLHPPIAYRV
jgi:hypothetical protein